MANCVEEGTRLGALLKYEGDKNYCRETVKIAKGENLELGTVVEVGTDGECKGLTADGEAYGVLIQDVDATKKEAEAVVVARDVLLAKPYVIFPEGADDAKKKTIITALEGRGIVIRDNVA